MPSQQKNLILTWLPSNMFGMIEKPASLDIFLASINGLPLVARASPALTVREQQCGTSSSDGKRWKNTDMTTSIVPNSPSCHSEETDQLCP